MGVDARAADAVIVGAGPAGVSCAVWLTRLGLAAVLVDACQQVGGLCRRNPYADDWNVALPGMTGEQVADNLAVSLDQARVPVLLSRTVTCVRPCSGGFAVSLRGEKAQGDTADQGLVLRSSFLVLATGVRPRTLAGCKPGAVAPDVLVGPGKHVMQHDFHGQNVAVLGGGDNAFENALYAMQRGAAAVTVFARTVRAQHQFVAQMPGCNMRVGNYTVDAARTTVDGQPFDLIMVFYGWEPCVQFASSLQLGLTDAGFVETDPITTQTSHDRVYAIGEVAQRQHPCVVTAMADGVVAAKVIQARVEATRVPFG